MKTGAAAERQPHFLVLKRSGDVGEKRVDFAAQQIDRGYDHNGDASCDHGVLDGSRALLVVEEPSDGGPQIKSRKKGIRGASAGGIGSSVRFFGYSHLRA